MGKEIKNRAISKEFMEDLKDGYLTPLLERVKKDDTLCLELRGDYINIYYRGGALYVIKKDLGDHNYQILYNEDYNKDINVESKSASYVVIPTVEQAVEEVPIHKQTMDFYFSRHPKLEREFQQLILRENNNSGKVSDATDYYILDIEYAFKGNNDIGDEISARYDMLAVKWPSVGQSRKKVNDLPISFIEIKYGDGAMGSGANLKGAGIHKHINDYINFRKDGALLKHLADDMAKVFNQKHELGLISSYQEKQGKLNITLNETKLELLLVLVNHDPAKSKLLQEIGDAISEWGGKEEEKYLGEILIAKSSLVGHGLYALDEKENSRFENIRTFYERESGKNQ